MRKRLFILLTALLLWSIPRPATATVLDLTTVGSSGFINGALFQQASPQPTGTGVIQSFVQLGNATPSGNVIQGYNTTHNNVFDNKSSDTFNHALLLSDVPNIDIHGTYYRAFLLDINQDQGKNNDYNNLYSLDSLQIFLSGTPNQSVTSFNSGILALSNADLIYNMDANSNSWIKLDSSLNHGSGSGDMYALIPDSLFLSSSKQYVYLYSRFGENIPNNGGFEEWAAAGPDPDPTPEPMTLLSFAFGLFGMGGIGFLKRRRLA